MIKSKTMDKRFKIFLCCLIAGTGLLHAAGLHAYEKTTSVDVGIGASYNISSYNTVDKGAALFSGRVGHSFFRVSVSRFFSMHWGAYVAAGIVPNSFLSTQKAVLDKLHPKDDGYDYITPCKPKGRRGYSLAAGAIYRWDKSHWSLRPMIGVGVSSYNIDEDYVAYRKVEGTNRMDMIQYSLAQDSHRGITSLVVTPAVEVTLHLSRKFDFFCNLSYEINTADVWQKYQLTELHSGKVIESGISKEPIGNNIGVCFGVRYHIR